MKNTMKKLLTAAFIFFLFSSSFAQSVPRVVDTVNLFTDEEKSELISACRQIENQYGIGVYLVAVDEPLTTNIENYAEQIYIINNFGYGENKTGIMLILDFDERDYDILCHGSMAHTVFTDNVKSRIADSFLSYLKSGDYYGGYADFLGSVTNYLSAYNEKIERRAQKHAGRIDTETLVYAIILGFVSGLIIALISCLVMKAQMKSVKIAKRADNYILRKQVKITESHDMFTHNTTVVHDIPQASSNGGTSINSGGFSHSSGKF